MEPHAAITDWQERMRSRVRGAVGYEVYGIDGRVVGTVHEVVGSGEAQEPAMLVRSRSRRALLPLEIVRAIDPERRSVVLTIGAAAFERLPDDEPTERQHPAAPEPHLEEPGHLLLFAGPSGYVLEARGGPPPAAGAPIAAGGRDRRVAKLGPSPLPGDRRLCAYLI